MKTFLFIFALSLSLISLSKESCSRVESPSKDACNNGLSDSDKKYFEKCCYVKYKNDGSDTEHQECWPLTKYKFEHINDVKKNYQFQYSDTMVIECNSHYIKFGLLSLALLFI